MLAFGQLAAWRLLVRQHALPASKQEDGRACGADAGTCLANYTAEAALSGAAIFEWRRTWRKQKQHKPYN